MTLKTRLRHKNIRLLIAVVFVLSLAARSEAGLKIYYIRHAEGGHNVVKEWEKVPPAQRPAYVGNPNVFTPKGETQVAAATKKLRNYHFDFIAVSPAWRTRHTVLPYLKAVGAKAEVWPELLEFEGGSMILSTNLPPPATPILDAGDRVEVPADETGAFSVREDVKKGFKLPAGQGEQREAAVQLIVRRVIELIHQRFGGSDKSILLVGHGHSGKALLKMLTNDELADFRSIDNTGIWMAEEQPDGKFKLEIYNDAPFDQRKAASAPKR